MFTFGKTCVAVSVFMLLKSMKKFPVDSLAGLLYIPIACTDNLEVHLHNGTLDFVYLCGFLVFCFASKRS